MITTLFYAVNAYWLRLFQTFFTLPFNTFLNRSAYFNELGSSFALQLIKRL